VVQHEDKKLLLAPNVNKSKAFVRDCCFFSENIFFPKARA